MALAHAPFDYLTPNKINTPLQHCLLIDHHVSLNSHMSQNSTNPESRPHQNNAESVTSNCTDELNATTRRRLVYKTITPTPNLRSFRLHFERETSTENRNHREEVGGGIPYR